MSRAEGQIGEMNTQATLHPVDVARVQRTWARLAPIYDLVYGGMLQPGRRRAVARMVLGPGDRVLEIGVGTGMGLDLYPRWARVTGIDLSQAMLDRARTRVADIAPARTSNCARWTPPGSPSRMVRSMSSTRPTS